MTIKPWDKRLDDLNTSKGVSNKMIQACMLAEIKELRKELRNQWTRFERAINHQGRATTTRFNRQARLLEEARQRAKVWRAHATRYQKLAAGGKE